MVRVLSLDIGKQLGFGLLDSASSEVKSGSLEILQTWQPYGASGLIFEGRVGALIDKFKPTHLAVARPFVRYARGKMIDTPDNLVPMFGAFFLLHRLAATRKMPLLVEQESDARSHLVGKNMMMAKSEAIKKAVIQACRDRGWPARDDHAGDALCIAAAALERLQPRRAHQTTPLFQKQGCLRRG